MGTRFGMAELQKPGAWKVVLTAFELCRPQKTCLKPYPRLFSTRLTETRYRDGVHMSTLLRRTKLQRGC